MSLEKLTAFLDHRVCPAQFAYLCHLSCECVGYPFLKFVHLRDLLEDEEDDDEDELRLRFGRARCRRRDFRSAPLERDEDEAEESDSSGKTFTSIRGLGLELFASTLTRIIGDDPNTPSSMSSRRRKSFRT